MKQWKHLVACAVLSAALSAKARAQACVGLPSTSIAPINLTGAASFTDGVKGFGGRLGFGGARGFGGVSAEYISYDDIDANAGSFGGDAGIIVPIGTTRKAEVCPIVQASYQNGPNTGTPFGSTERSVVSGGIGLALGGAVDVSPTFAVIPFARAGILTVRGTLSGVAEEELSQTETGGVIAGGFGLRFNDIFTITPGVSIPVGFDGTSDPVFTLGATIGFRRGR